MKLIKFLTLILLLFPAVACFGSNNDIWAEANAAYDQGDFNSAIEGYRKLLERGHRHPVVYYNLGNAYFKKGKIGLAIAAYGHSLKIDPSFKSARENLEYVRKFTVDKVEEKAKGFLLNIWYGLVGLLTAEEYFVMTAIVYWILCAIITFLMIDVGRREFLTYLLILFSTIFILGIATTRFVVKQTHSTRWGVVVVPSVELREGPGEEFEKIFTGHEGLEFKILSQRQDYYLIELGSGLKGWIPVTTLTEI
jgi:hypothetical protein